MGANAMGSVLRCCVVAGLALAAEGCGWRGPEDSPSIVLITVDTLRADHLSTYGYFRHTSPTLDEFAREAMLFERALTTMATTLPAHASLMTSTRTTTHGLKGNFQHLGVALDQEKGLRTMAEMLGDLGYQTAAFVSAAPVRAHTGLQRGFETFDQPTEKERPADATTERVIAWLQADRRKPFFLWIHYFDPHRPRRPPAPYEDAFANDSSLVEFLKERAATRTDGFVLKQNNAYDGEILFTDSQIGRVFETLKSLGEWREAAVVVTADHGEGLGQHDWMDHGKIYNEQLLVPLIIKFPPGRGPRGVRDSAIASLIDVAPTLVAALDLHLTESDRRQFEGIDLLSRSRARPGVFSEQSHRVSELGLRFSLTNERWKYFHRTRAADELYDLVEDPHETEDVLDRHPEIAKEMRDGILAILAGSDLQAPDAAGAELEEETVQQLRALGYLGGATDDGGPNLWKGVVVWGHEVRQFRRCGSQEPLWVVDETGELWQKYRDLVTASDPYAEAYAELLGQLQPPPAEGFGAEYPGMIRVTEVVDVIPADLGCPDS